MTLKPLRVLIAFLLLIIAGGASGWSASEPVVTRKEVNVPGMMQIVFEEDLLSVSLKHADLEEVLKEVSRQSNIRINFNDLIKEKVTLEFVNLPLEGGLKRLLKNQDYFFTYLEKKEGADKETKYVLSRVVLLWKSSSSQRESGQIPVVSEEAALSPSSQDISLTENEISSDLIDELLSQEPQMQERALRTLAQPINSSLEQINTQFLEALEQARNKDQKNLGLEAVERLFRKGEIGEIKPMIPDPD